MSQKLYTAIMAVLVLAIIACSDNVAGSSEDPNTVTAKNNQSSSSDAEISSSAIIESSSSIKTLSSSSEKVVLCKVAPGGQGCVIESDTADLWLPGMDYVNTKVFATNLSNFGERAGEFFLRTDSAEGGKSTITRKGRGFFDIELNKGDLKDYPYVDIGFYVGGFDSNGVAMPVDISNWNGICFYFFSTFTYYTRQYENIGPMILLDFGEEVNKSIDNKLPFVFLEDGVNCYEWNRFGPLGPSKDHFYEDQPHPYWDADDYFAGENAAKHVVRIIIRLQAGPGKYSYDIRAIGTNRDE